jgi:uncharacterized protein YneF (UPF0154 family)
MGSRVKLALILILLVVVGLLIGMWAAARYWGAPIAADGDGGGEVVSVEKR